MSHQIDLDLAEAAARVLLTKDPDVSVNAAARKVGMTESTLRRRLAKNKSSALLESPEVGVFPDGSATLDADEASTIEETFEEHGLTAEDWEVISVRAGRWGNDEDQRKTFRMSAIRKDNLLREADLSNFTPPPAPAEVEDADRSIVICGDHHAPHQDRGLHECMLAYLADEQPHEGVILGDLADFSTISRHRTQAGFAQSVNENSDAVVSILNDYRSASPNTHWTILRGNHDDRLEYALMDHNPELYQIRPGTILGESDVPALNLRRLWHLDLLNIDLVDTEWKLGKYAVTPSLTARHGYLVSEGAGHQMLNKHSNSQIQGHSHRMRFTYRTKHDPQDVRVAIEAGTMAQIADGLGYATEPNWQQGFVVGAAFEDGDFALAPAIYLPGRLLLSDGRRYTTDTEVNR